MRPCLGAMPRFEDEKKFLPLQAANLYAWNVRRTYYEDDKKPILLPNTIIKEFRDMPPISVELGYEELRQFRKFLLMNLPRAPLVFYAGSKVQQKREKAAKKLALKIAKKPGG